eukprot:TRINITY_DN10849_c0_g1_i5.p1 TRINITY_DN10849_c0_g1~~TRINITY_DN10849_c0_g1_i5.p1  ORF type:complete len:226 (+),score=27.39 TRINITY_DN10849_c0_g1_i5:220-897(+)
MARWFLVLLLQGLAVRGQTYVAQLKSRDGICLQVKEPGVPGSFVYMQACDGSAAQRWWIHGSDIRPDSGFLCLTLLRPRKLAVSDVRLWPCIAPRLEGQIWDYNSASGLLRLNTTESDQSAKCLSAPSRTQAGSDVIGTTKCDSSLRPNQWDYQSPADDQPCDPECTFRANCVAGRCQCIPAYTGSGCVLTCLKQCVDDRGTEYCCVSSQEVGSDPIYRPLGFTS